MTAINSANLRTITTLTNSIQTIERTARKFFVKRRSQATDSLRALLLQPENGQRLHRDYEFQVDDVLIISAKIFGVEYLVGSHSLIAHVVSVNPLRFDICELTNKTRSLETELIGQKLDSSTPRCRIYFTVSRNIATRAIENFLTLNLIEGNLFKLNISYSLVEKAFRNIVLQREAQRGALSRDRSPKPVYYGIQYGCNNAVFDTVVEAIKLRNDLNKIMQSFKIMRFISKMILAIQQTKEQNV